MIIRDEYRIGQARYAKDMWAIQITPNGSGFKQRADYLVEELCGHRYSNREGAYIVSRRGAERFHFSFEMERPTTTE